MNARSCQLCGKPLSRLRVGGDGDFCSREHRNQHRLRRGMDRLEEANKVTSLMRRRENPRHISAARLMCNSALERRGFFESQQPARGAGAFSPVLRGPAEPRIGGGADRCLPPRVTRLPGSGVSRWADASGSRIDGRGTLPLLPPCGQSLPARISRAPLVSLQREAPAPLASRRDFGMLRPSEIRVYLSGATLAPGAPDRRGALALERHDHLCRIESFALEGKALRVSVGIGFRVGAANWQGFSRWPQAPAEMVWPRTPRRYMPEIHDYTALYRKLGVGIWTMRACLPAVGSAMRPARFVFPGAVAPRKRQPATIAPPAKRTTDLSWKPAEPQSRGMAVRPPAAGFGARNGSHLFRIALMPSRARGERQVAFTAFIPQEPKGCPVVGFEGTVAAAIAGPAGAAAGAAPAAVDEIAVSQPAAPAAVVHIEEHFGSGWDNWMGGTKDWKVDVAGVRTGPLALFVPTLELIDYRLDFLARIDTRSVTWVVRAAGLDEYLRCTLTAVPGGEVEFSRCAVVAGAAQAPITAVNRLPGKPRSAMTVSTRVEGDSFTVSVDGKTIETWDDDRFPMGGVGFQGAPEDRARLYWVRLSSTESTAKEHQKK
jgi:hypothetical protein